MTDKDDNGEAPETEAEKACRRKGRCSGSPEEGRCKRQWRSFQQQW